MYVQDWGEVFYADIHWIFLGWCSDWMGIKDFSSPDTQLSIGIWGPILHEGLDGGGGGLVFTIH